MRIAIDRQTLCDAVAHVSRAVATKSTIPALEGIMLMAEGEQLTMVAYNLEIGMTKVLAARVEEAGEVILNAKLFGDIVRRLPGDMVSLTVDERLMCQITSGSAKFDILGISTSEFPEMPSLTESQALTMPGEVLQGMVRQTIFAVAQNDAKPVHTGILFELSGGELRLVAVDGFRLAVRKEKLATDNDMRFIVAGKAMAEVVKLITDETEDVTLRVGKRHISFEIDGYTLISRLLDGEFLDYHNTIPKAFASTVRINTREVADTVERISLIISDRLKSPVRCQIQAEGIEFSCVTAMGRAVDRCGASLDGADIEIGFNNRYLLDALRYSRCDKLVFEVSGPLSPVKVLPKDGGDFLFLVLPVRFKND